MSDRGGRAKWPWERDPNDKEANYRRPIPPAERIRLGLKGAIVVGVFLAIRAAVDRSDPGPKLLVIVGAALALVGLIDLVWTVRGNLEHVFIESRPAQLAAHGALALGGVALALAAAAAL